MILNYPTTTRCVKILKHLEERYYRQDKEELFFTKRELRKYIKKNNT